LKVRKAILLLLVFLFNIPVLAQVDTAWVRKYNNAELNIYSFRDLAVDKSGNVYVAGWASGIGNVFIRYLTIKYGPNGNILWAEIFDESDGVAQALAVDDSGHAYVCGNTYEDNSIVDFLTIKYGSNGDTLWVRRYNGPANLNDGGRDLMLDAKGNLYVMGSSERSDHNEDYVTIKYLPNGDTLWINRYDSGFRDLPNTLTVDDSGNVYAAGWSDAISSWLDYVTVKYGPDGDTSWVRRYDGTGNYYDEAFDLAVDHKGNSYVTGYSFGIGTFADITTIKYSPKGDTLWVARFNGPKSGNDWAVALVVDDSENVYVAGAVDCDPDPEGVSTCDYATIKYSSDGDILWFNRYNELGNDYAYDLSLDKYGNVYVTGNISTIKYSSNGIPLWLTIRSGINIQIDDSGFVYVTDGYYVTKYIQFDCTAISGDVNSDNQILLSDITSLINSLFKSQPAPNPLCLGDVNVDGKILLSDIVYLINYLYKSGPEPVKNRECCL